MLHFNGLEPIDFRGKLCEPKLDVEKRLRLQNISFDTEEKTREANDVLASCFDDEYARNFIREKLSNDDKLVLKTYLVGGETGLNRLSDATNRAIESYLSRNPEELTNG